jgi:hypothetical protein
MRSRLYTLRILHGGPVRGDIDFSLPARCFKASLRSAHRLDLHSSADGSIIALQWRYHKGLNCSTGSASGEWPAMSDVKVVVPVPGQDIKELVSTLLDGVLQLILRDRPSTATR